MELKAEWDRLTSALLYHIYTLWLFTCNDLKTMVFPSTAFALFNCGYMETQPAEFFFRLPNILLWTWVNLLAFTINNQHNALAIREDQLNKPWRPIPAGRLSAGTARKLGHFAYVLAQGTSVLAGGGLVQSSLLSVLGYLYNELGGDHGLVTRNVLNAAGFTSFASGALEVAWGGVSVLTVRPMLSWLGLIAAVVATTVHSQDMYDQEGDALAGRRTVPLVIGDRPARFSIAIAVACWSVVGPWYWMSGLAGYFLLGTLGAWVAWRTMRRTLVEEDKATFRIYNVWLVSMYSLPVLAQWNNSV
ncbi:hypothetical protein SLS62_000668 [Diatrype stigma]|uniref:UbiA prenyltransferase n=1 Tax=Diatrype stigma TaxID=117547 RepID=A0AAN9V070_9PEZI